MAQVTIALWQCAPTVSAPTVSGAAAADVADNLARLTSAAQQARARGADVLVAPELVLTGYDVGALSPVAETVPGGSVAQALSRVAREAGVALVVGAADQDEDGTWRNCSFVLDSTGQVRARYVKVHLFGEVDRSRFVPGTRLFEMTELCGIRLATMVCYDVEIPEGVRAAALAGADLLAVPTANMEPYRIVSDTLVPARAWENQMWVAYANHCGTEGSTRYVGRSLVADHEGRAVARAGGTDEEIVLATLDTDELARSRRDNPYLRDRRPELYTSLTEEQR